MSDIGKSERVTQNRVIALFRDELEYRYLGDWSDRDGNSNIEEGLLADYLKRSGYSGSRLPSPSTSSGPRRTTIVAVCTATIRPSIAFFATARR